MGVIEGVRLGVSVTVGVGVAVTWVPPIESDAALTSIMPPLTHLPLHSPTCWQVLIKAFFICVPVALGYILYSKATAPAT